MTTNQHGQVSTTDSHRPDAETAEIPPTLRLSDRRTSERVQIVKPGKIFRRSTQQYVAAQSRDVSNGGALLEVDSARAFKIGEILDIALAMSPGAVVTAAGMSSAVVVRASSTDDAKQRVAIRYVGSVSMLRAA